MAESAKKPSRTLSPSASASAASASATKIGPRTPPRAQTHQLSLAASRRGDEGPSEDQHSDACLNWPSSDKRVSSILEVRRSKMLSACVRRRAEGKSSRFELRGSRRFFGVLSPWGPSSGPRANGNRSRAKKTAPDVHWEGSGKRSSRFLSERAGLLRRRRGFSEALCLQRSPPCLR